MIEQGIAATPSTNLSVNPKLNSTVQGQTAIVEPVSVKDLSKSVTFNQDVKNFTNTLLNTEDVIDNQGKPSQKYSLKPEIKQEQLNKMSNSELVLLLANDKVFKNSTSILNEMDKGVIRIDANGNHSNSPNFNPNTAGRYFLNGNSPQYRNPELYNNINTAKGVKPIYSNELHNGITNINNLFNVVPELKGNKINIGSGARSIEDNIMVYSNQKNLKNLTKSNHSSFNAIDISTNVNNADDNNNLSNGGNKLFD